MQSVLAFLWFPVVVYALSLGVGLLVEAAALGRGRLPDPLVPGVGFAGLVLASYATYRLGATIAPALAVVVVLAVAGLVVRRGDWRRLRPGSAGLALLGAYLLYLAPALSTGHWTWAGYTFTGDPALNFVAVDWILHHGFHAAAQPTNAYELAANGQIAVHYPLAPYLLLGTLRPLAGVPLLATFQPGIAIAMGIGALALCWLLESAGLSRGGGGGGGGGERGEGRAPPPAVAGALLACGANLLYVDGQIGGLKEVSTVAFLATAAGLAQLSLRQRLTPRSAAIGMLPLAATLASISAGGLIYALVLGLATAGVALAVRPRPGLGRVAVAAGVCAVVFAVLASPVLRDTVSFGRSATTVYTQAPTGPQGGLGTDALGYLLRPIPPVQAFGVWLGQDWLRAPTPWYRFGATCALLALMALLAALGLGAAARRHSWGVPLLVAATGLTVVGLHTRASPYASFKLLIVASPALVLAGALGTWTLWRRFRLAGALVAAALALGVAATDAILYREARLTPTARLAALEDAAHHARGHGLVELNEFDEYGKYLLRSAEPNSGSEHWGPRELQPTVPGRVFGSYFDLDQQRLEFVDSFPALILRRSPAASRPPANFHLAYQNRWYQLWLLQPGPQVVAHLPLQSPLGRQAVPDCGALRAFAAQAGPGERLVASRWPPAIFFDPVGAAHPASWVHSPDMAPGTVAPAGAGRADGRVWVSGGRYTAWIQGTSGRPIQGTVDTREVATLDHVDTPGQWTEGAVVTLGRGWHEAQLRKGHLGLKGGSGYAGSLGPLALQPAGPGRLVQVAPRQASRLCGQPLDWVERVRG